MGIISLLCSALQLQSILGLALGTIVTEVLTTGQNIDACDAATIYHLLLVDSAVSSRSKSHNSILKSKTVSPPQTLDQILEYNLPRGVQYSPEAR